MYDNTHDNIPKKRNWKKIVLIVLAVILAVALALVLAVSIYWNAMLSKIGRMDDQPTITLSSEEMDAIMNELNDPNAVDTTQPTDPLVTDESQILGKSDSMINIMLIGQDTRSTNPNARGRSDTMILCTINTETKTITLTSFLRDLYVKLPDYGGKSWGYNRLNVNYVFGGREMLDLCMQMNFGIAVDHFVEVNFSGFSDLVDLMGGVDIELTGLEAYYLNSGDRHWRLREGMNHLNGAQALTYARIRKIDGDFQRTARQRKVLNALFAKVKTMDPGQIHGLLSEALPLLRTDMTNGEITEYALTLIPMLPELQIQNLRIPADDTYYYSNKGTQEAPMSVIVPDLEANRQILREFLGEETVSGQ